MKSTTSIFLLGLVVNLTSGLPNPSSTSTTTVVNIVTVVPLAARSPYPDEPITNEFQYLNFEESSDTDKATRTIIHEAFKDWAAVIQKAIDSQQFPGQYLSDMVSGYGRR